MIIAEKIQEKNEDFLSIEGIVRKVLSHEDVENSNKIFPTSAPDLRITRTLTP